MHTNNTALQATYPLASSCLPPFAWVEVGLGEGGLSWLAGVTSLLLQNDALRRPTLWIDTHNTLTPEDWSDFEGQLILVRPTEPQEAYAVAEIALRSGAFCCVALEMYRALHPTHLARLARAVHGRSSQAQTSLIIWGEPTSFVSPPKGAVRIPFKEAVQRLFEKLKLAESLGEPNSYQTLQRESA